MRYVFAVLSCLLLAVQVTDAQDTKSSSDRGRAFAMEFGAGLGGYYGLWRISRARLFLPVWTGAPGRR